MIRLPILGALLASLLLAGCGGLTDAPAVDPTQDPVIKAASSKPAGSRSETRKVTVDD